MIVCAKCGKSDKRYEKVYIYPSGNFHENCKKKDNENCEKEGRS